MRKLIALTILASPLAACGTQTTYHLRSGHELQGEITGRLGNAVDIRTARGTQTVDACDVMDVDHPGRAAAITGTVLLGVGAMLLTTTLASVWLYNDSDYRPNPSVAVTNGALGAVSGAFIATGGGLAWWGYSQWSESAELASELPTDCEPAQPGDDWRGPDEPPPLTRDSRLRRPGVTPAAPAESMRP